jgi:photosystem II stability/assembly factor-like uncharacterized protein
MKTVIISVILILNLNMLSFSQWTVLPIGNLEIAHSGIFFINRTTGFIGGVEKVYKTTDAGLGWTSFPVGINSWDYVKTIRFLNNNTGFLTVRPYYIYRTTNSGANWTLSHTNSEVMADIACFNDAIYVSGGHNVFLRSTNFGDSWQQINQIPGDTFSYMSMSFLNSMTGYAGGNLESYDPERLIKTTNGGLNWSALPWNTYNILQIQFLDENTGYLFRPGGIDKTTNGGLNWSTLWWHTNFNGSKMKFLSHSTGWLSKFQNGAELFVTTNGGMNWILQESIPISGYKFHELYVSDTFCATTADLGRFYKTTNGGGIFTFVHSVSGTIRFQDNNDPVTSGYVKALRYDSVSHNIITIDSAQIQSNGAYTLPNCPPVWLDIMAYENDEDALSFVPTYYVSTINWQSAAHVKPDSNLSNINVAVKRIVNPGDSMHVSGYVYTNNASDYSALKDAVVYSRASGIFKSHSISLMNGYYCVDSLPSGVYELIVDRMGYIGGSFVVTITNSSLNNVNFYLDDILLPLNSNTGTIPADFILNQNYPNPFNPVASISFEVPKTAFVKLVVYDLLGREIETLVNQGLSAGKYKADWNAENYPSGVYFYSLLSEGFTQTRRMVLLK